MTNQSMFNTIKREFQYGDQQVVIETGRIARQAHSINCKLSRKNVRGG